MQTTPEGMGRRHYLTNARVRRWAHAGGWRATVIQFTAYSNTDDVHRSWMEERLPSMRQQPSLINYISMKTTNTEGIGLALWETRE